MANKRKEKIYHGVKTRKLKPSKYRYEQNRKKKIPAKNKPNTVMRNLPGQNILFVTDNGDVWTVCISHIG